MSMLYVDVAEVLNGDYSPPEPDVLPLSDAVFLFYSAEFNLVHGDTESGKTWLCPAGGRQHAQRRRPRRNHRPGPQRREQHPVAAHRVGHPSRSSH